MSLVMAAPPGKIPTTAVRRLISPFGRSTLRATKPFPASMAQRSGNAEPVGMTGAASPP
jgi:hypothetical protein